MVKFVINDCFGGFSLSREAVLLGRELSGDPSWGGPCIVGDTYPKGETVDHDYGYVDVDRRDAILVEVVEKLKEKASGLCACLKVVKLKEGTKFRITVYDGAETVETEDSIDWEVA